MLLSWALKNTENTYLLILQNFECILNAASKTRVHSDVKKHVRDVLDNTHIHSLTADGAEATAEMQPLPWKPSRLHSL